MAAKTGRTKTAGKTGRRVGRPLTDSVSAFTRRYAVVKELRNGMVVRDKRTGKHLKVYGDKEGNTVVEPYTP